MSRTLLVFPGASLMRITASDEGLLITCPGCGEQVTLQPESRPPIAFAHDVGCPVHAQIASALRRHDRDVVRRG
jgi:hypothetical protein